MQFNAGNAKLNYFKIQRNTEKAWISCHILTLVHAFFALSWILEDFTYILFLRFVQPKYPDGGSILSSSQFTLLPELASKILLDLKEVKIDSKIIIFLC